MATKKRKTRESWGRIRKLPSGRHQASYQGPDLAVYKAPNTFQSLDDAREWLRSERKIIDGGDWVPPDQRDNRDDKPTFRQYVEPWLAGRNDIKQSTRDWYRGYLDRHILPTLGDLPMDKITPVTIRRWHAGLKIGPTAKAHSYAMVRAAFNAAITDEILTSNPCKIRGAGSTTKRRREVRPATAEELQAIIDALPRQFQAMALLAAWTGLRFGEITELRRSDVDLGSGVIHVRRGVLPVRGDNGRYRDEIGAPKSEAGIRDIWIPPHIVPVIRGHIEEFSPHWFKCHRCTPEAIAEHGRDGLIFPSATSSGHLQSSVFAKDWIPAREKGGRPDLHFHDFRHGALTRAAQLGATTAELMAIAGHSSGAMAMRYQHVTDGRLAEIAKRASKLATLTE